MNCMCSILFAHSGLIGFIWPHFNKIHANHHQACPYKYHCKIQMYVYCCCFFFLNFKLISCCSGKKPLAILFWEVRPPVSMQLRVHT